MMARALASWRSTTPRLQIVVTTQRSTRAPGVAVPGWSVEPPAAPPPEREDAGESSHATQGYATTGLQVCGRVRDRQPRYAVLCVWMRKLGG